MSGRAVLSALAAMAVLAAAWWAAEGRPDAESPALGDPAPVARPAAGGTPARASGTQAAGPADSLVTVTDAMGLSIDASRLLQLGLAGGLVIDADTRAAIEAMINALPPDPTAHDLERLQHTLRAGMPFEEAEKAFKLVTGYRAYTHEVQREMLPLGIPKDRAEAKAFFDQMDAVRRRHFDAATADAMFGAEDRFARVSMEAAFVEQDGSLSPDQKRQAIDELRRQLPADKRELLALPETPGSPPGS